LQSREYPNALEKLFGLQHRKTEYQPGESRQKSILVTGLQAHSSKKIRTDHLQAVAAGLSVPSINPAVSSARSITGSWLL
jgi:hypothetical protein